MLQEFAQEVEDTARGVVDEIHTALPGEIIAFDPGSGLASAKPLGKYTTSKGESMDYPTVTDAPVQFPYCQTSGTGIAYPVVKGDSCLIIISEIELDEWRSGAESEGSLQFDLSSAVVIPGLLNGGGDIIAKACTNNAVVISGGGTEVMVSEAGATLDAGGAKLEVTDSGVTITGKLTVTGNITTSSGTVKAGSIDLKEHVHQSAAPGSDTGKAK